MIIWITIYQNIWNNSKSNDNAVTTFTTHRSTDNTTGTNSSISLDSSQTSVSNNIQELYILISGQIGNLGNRMSDIDNLLLKRVTVTENKLQDEEIAQKNEQISQLSNTIVNMQKALNSIDNDIRSKNLIITGRPEDSLTIENTVANTDLEKINLVLSSIGLSVEQFGDLNCISRIGKTTGSGKSRMMKIVCVNNETCECIVKSSHKLNNKGGFF